MAPAPSTRDCRLRPAGVDVSSSTAPHTSAHHRAQPQLTQPRCQGSTPTSNTRGRSSTAELQASNLTMRVRPASSAPNQQPNDTLDGSKSMRHHFLMGRTRVRTPPPRKRCSSAVRAPKPHRRLIIRPGYRFTTRTWGCRPAGKTPALHAGNAGSIPASSITQSHRARSSGAEQPAHNRQVTGSNPVGPTTSTTNRFRISDSRTRRSKPTKNI